MDKCDTVNEQMYKALTKEPKAEQRPPIGQRRTVTNLIDAAHNVPSASSPYGRTSDHNTPERYIRAGSGGLKAHQRATVDLFVSSNDSASPVPLLLPRGGSSRQTCVERRTDLVKWNTGRDLTKALSELRVAEIESEELKGNYAKLRKEKIEVDRAHKELQKENEEMSGKIVEQVEWIQGQMERNHNLSGLLKEAKNFLESYGKKLWVANQEFKELGKFILTEKESTKATENCKCNCARNYCSTLDRIGAKLGILNKSMEQVSAQNPQGYIENLLKELSKEVEIRPNKKRTISGLIGKPRQDPLRDLKMKIEELQDEVKFGNKWKSMYTELLTDKSTPLPLPEDFESDSMLDKDFSPILNPDESDKSTAQVLKKELEDLREEANKNKEIAVTKESVVESLKREVKIAKDEGRTLQERNKDLSKQAEALRKQDKTLTEQLQTLTEQNAALKIQINSLKETKQRLYDEDYEKIEAENSLLKMRIAELEAEDFSPNKDIDSAVQRLSLAILKKCEDDELDGKDIALLQRVFGPNLMRILQTHKDLVRQYKEDCRSLLLLLRNSHGKSISELEKRKEVLEVINEVIDSTKEYEERKDILSGARQSLSINKLDKYHPKENIKSINAQLADLKTKHAEKINYFNTKYGDATSELNELAMGKEELKGDNDEFEQDLKEMKTLVKASKELTEVLKDASKVNIDVDSREETLDTAIFQQMLISVCGSIESLI